MEWFWQKKKREQAWLNFNSAALDLYKNGSNLGVLESASEFTQIKLMRFCDLVTSYMNGRIPKDLKFFSYNVTKIFRFLISFMGCHFTSPVLTKFSVMTLIYAG
jgi:hypothetical protein